MKDDLKKCGLDRGLAKDRERWKAQVIKLLGKHPTCASMDKGHKTKRERETALIVKLLILTAGF